MLQKSHTPYLRTEANCYPWTYQFSRWCRLDLHRPHDPPGRRRAYAGSAVCVVILVALFEFYRIKSRRGPKKAISAVAASILTAIYHMLKDGTMYKDLGRNHFDRRSTDQQKKRLVKRLADLGYAVEIKPLAA